MFAGTTKGGEQRKAQSVNGMAGILHYYPPYHPPFWLYNRVRRKRCSMRIDTSDNDKACEPVFPATSSDQTTPVGLPCGSRVSPLTEFHVLTEFFC